MQVNNRCVATLTRPAIAAIFQYSENFGVGFFGKARELAEQVKRIARPELERWLLTLAELDYALKGGSKRPAKSVLEHGILKLCRSSGGHATRPAQRAGERRA